MYFFVKSLFIAGPNEYSFFVESERSSTYRFALLYHL